VKTDIVKAKWCIQLCVMSPKLRVLIYTAYMLYVFCRILSNFEIIVKLQSLGWPLYAKHGHAFNAFKIMVTDPEVIFSDSTLNNEVISESVKHALLKDICRRMTPQPLKIRADLELTCFSSDGIECIKDAMRAAENVSTDECKVKVSLIASPLYVVTTQTLDKESGMAIIEEAIQEAMV